MSDTITFPAVTEPDTCPRCRRHKPHRFRWGLLLAAAMTVTLLAGGGVLAYSIVQPGRYDLSVPAGAKPFTWPHNDPPTGIVLSGLQDYIVSPVLVRMMERQIRATRYSWHANSIRLQILQDRLVGQYGRTQNLYYMYVIKTVARYAIHLGLTVVLNAQTEQSVGYGTDEQQPTYATWKFWQLINQTFSSNRHVVYDLFNEPRHCDWAQWLNGTTVDGTHYVGMQWLVTKIRNTDADNTIWVEGRNWDSTLEGVPTLAQPKGFPRIVYTIHHPGSTTERLAPANKELWWQSFGYLAARGIPVVDAEFAGYRGSYHWANPAKMIPEYLAYLTAHHVGLMAWSLVPGALNGGPNYDSVSHEPQGDGKLVRRWFSRVARDTHSFR